MLQSLSLIKASYSALRHCVITTIWFSEMYVITIVYQNISILVVGNYCEHNLSFIFFFFFRILTKSITWNRNSLKNLFTILYSNRLLKHDRVINDAMNISRNNVGNIFCAFPRPLSSQKQVMTEYNLPIGWFNLTFLHFISLFLEIIFGFYS